MNATLDVLGFVLVLAPVVLFFYAYFGYPVLLRLVARMRPDRGIPAGGGELPTVSITIPCYNEERSIAATLDRILAVDYPADRRQILIVSDASTDRTDEIVRSYADRGIELLRMPHRTGKTAAENAAVRRLRSGPGTCAAAISSSTWTPPSASGPIRSSVWSAPSRTRPSASHPAAT